jgi:hypothetical protein
MVGELCQRLGIGQTTYYRYEDDLYKVPDRKGQDTGFFRREFSADTQVPDPGSKAECEREQNLFAKEKAWTLATDSA